MKKTIASIKDFDGQPFRTYEGQQGTGASVELAFADGSNGSVGTKPDFAMKHVAVLESLVGKEVDFTLEAKPDYRGHKQWKVLDYPGKPTGQNKNKDFESAEERVQRQANIFGESVVKGLVQLAGEGIGTGRFGPSEALVWIDSNTDKMAGIITRAIDSYRPQSKSKTATTAPEGPPSTPVTPNHPKANEDRDSEARQKPQTADSGVVSTPVGGNPLTSAAVPGRGQDWKDAYDMAVTKAGSATKLKLALKANPEEVTAEVLEAYALSST